MIKREVYHSGRSLILSSVRLEHIHALHILLRTDEKSIFPFNFFVISCLFGAKTTSRALELNVWPATFVAGMCLLL